MKYYLLAVVTVIIIILNACAIHPGNGTGEGGGGSSSSVSSSGIIHPPIFNAGHLTTSRIILIYMAADCNLQANALINMQQLPTNYDESADLVLVYLDINNNTAFPAWMAPGGLFIRNTNRTEAGLSILDRYDRIMMPTNTVDACNINTMVQVFKYIKDNVTYVSNSIKLIFWGHGSGAFLPMPESIISIANDVNPFKGNIGRSFGLSDTSKKSLSDDEITWAITNVLGKQNYMIGFDACYMGNLESAYNYDCIRNAGSGGVGYCASPGAEASTGWNYAQILGNIEGNTPSGVNVAQYSLDDLWIPALYNNLDNFFQDIAADPEKQKFYITNLVQQFNPPSTAVNGENGFFNSTHRTYAWYYVCLYDLMRDFSQKFGGGFTTYFNNYCSVLSTGGMFNGTNASLWMGLFPKHFYSEPYKSWHSAAAIKLFREHPLIANVLTNAEFSQTENSLYLFTLTSYIWSRVSNNNSGGTVSNMGTYTAYPLDHRYADQTFNTSLWLTSTILSKTNVGFITGPGQQDYYSISILTGGTIKIRISSYGPYLNGLDCPISNVVLCDKFKNPILTLNYSDFHNSTDPTGLAVTRSFTSSVSTVMSEYGNVKTVDIITNLTPEMYFIVINGRDTQTNSSGSLLWSWDYKNQITELPYLLYVLPGNTAVYQ